MTEIMDPFEAETALKAWRRLRRKSQETKEWIGPYIDTLAWVLGRGRLPPLLRKYLREERRTRTVSG